MLDGLLSVAGAGQVLPFVLMFYGALSAYLWEDDAGDVHTIRQEEGGEHGDALVPSCSPLAITAHSMQFRRSSRRVNTCSRSTMTSTPQVLPNESVRCTHSPKNICVVFPVFGSTEGTQVWNQSVVRPGACDVRERIARASDPPARVWKGPGLPQEQQGMKVLGAPFGHPSFVETFLVKVAEQRTLLDRIPLVADLQASWLLCRKGKLFVSGGGTRSSGAVRQQTRRGSVELHVRHFQGGFTSDRSDQGHCEDASGPGRDGPPKFALWATWADSWAMMHARHREVASQFVHALENDLRGPWLSAAAQARRTLTGVTGFEPPSWQAVAEGARPETQPPDEFEPGVRQGWQHEAASGTEEHFREVIFDISDMDRALVSSQAGPGAGVALRVAPTSRLTRIQPRWPSPCSLRKGRRSEAQGSCTGEYSCKDTQGRWRSGRHHQLHAGYGLALPPLTTEVWKFWLAVFICLEGPSSRLTRPSCAQCFVMVLHTLEPPSVMESFSRRRAGGRSDGTQNWWDLAAALAWWCSRWKLGAGGQLRPGLSLLTWPKHRLVKRCGSCKDAQNKRGA